MEYVTTYIKIIEQHRDENLEQFQDRINLELKEYKGTHTFPIVAPAVQKDTGLLIAFIHFPVAHYPEQKKSPVKKRK